MSTNNVTVWSKRLISSTTTIRKESGIYKITSLHNKKVYIGSAKNLRYRNVIHYNDLVSNRHHSIKLQRAWNKYGESNFIFEILEFCEKEKLIEREQFYLDTLQPFYNTLKIAGSNLGFKHSKETKERLSKIRQKKFDSGELSAWNKGLKNLPPRRKSTKKKISKGLKGIKRKPFTPEHRLKMSTKAKARKLREKLNKEK
jgi:group I intron endonuclease